MAEPKPEAWIEDDREFPPPEPAPADWAPPAPVEAEIEPAAGLEVKREEAEIAAARFHRGRRFWGTTAAFFGVWVLSIFLIHTETPLTTRLLFLLPFYVATLGVVLRRPKRVKGERAKLVDRLDWQYKVMIGVVVFLAIYLPFTFFSDAIIPFASLVEYGLFALLLFLLLRLGGRSTGVAASLEALPPPSHRLHQQVVAPIDDTHYQKTLWLNYNFIEKGRGARQLARRVDEIMESNGVAPERRAAVLAEIQTYRDEAGFHPFRRGAGRAEGRERRVQVLERIFARLNEALEQRA